MNNKRFTFVELVVTIVVLSILLSIVLLKVSDFKKKAIVNSVNSNISILQTAVDTFYLKEENYPILNSSNLNLSNPQEIDIERLVKEGYLKKELDTSKVKNQYYWVDVFGKVWGATNKEVGSINLLKSKDGTEKMEFKINRNFNGFDVYEVEGYNSLLSADTNKSSKKSYKVIDSVKFKGNNEQLINFKLPKSDANYLVAMIDEYGLELPPMGKFSGSKSPVYRGDGIHQFEIKGSEEMYWVDFLTLEDKRGDSTIEYRFKVKDKNGDFLPWTRDFFSLPESKHIVVEVDMKSDKEGNKPTLYDIQILFKYKDEIDPINPIERGCDLDCYGENITCPPSGFTETFNKETGGTKVIPFYVNNSSISKTYINNPFTSKGNYEVISAKYYIEVNGTYQLMNDLNQILKEKCGFVIYDVNVLKGESNSENSKPEDAEYICGVGGTKSKFYSSNQKIVYAYFISEETTINSINVNIHSDNIKSIQYEQSINGDSFEVIDSLSEIRTPSCLNVVYEFDGSIPTNVTAPIIKGCEKDCSKVEVCESDCESAGPTCIFECTNSSVGGSNNSCKGEDCISQFEPCQERDCNYPPCEEDCTPIKKEPEWETVDTMRFFGYGPMNRPTNWYHVDIKDENFDKENTRIIYNFAKKNNGSWSNLYDDFKTTGIANSVMVVAFIQVKTAAMDKISEEQYPYVTSIVFDTEAGDISPSMTNPNLIITPKKDNNKGRDVFTTTSNIEWDVVVSDPRNLKITNVEWSGDIRNNYPIGSYIINARATNERGYSSEWVSYQLNVIAETPVASFNLEGNKDYVYAGEQVKFDTSASAVPDGDKIVEYDWKNKKDVYSKSEAGSKTVSLRVKDEEGNWSNWTEKTFYILDSDNRFWFVNGLPPEISGHLKAFDNDASTYASFNQEAIVTWDADLNGRTVLLNLSAVSSGQTTSFEFLDKNNIPLYFIKNDEEYTNKHTHIGIKTVRAVVPEGAKSIRLTGTNRYSDISSIEVVVKTNDVLEPTNLMDVSTQFRNVLSFDKGQNTSKTYMIDLSSKKVYSTTNNTLTTDMMEPNKTVEYLIFSVDSNFNASKFVRKTLKTLLADVAFSGLDQKAFDKDSGTYASFSREAIVTWDVDLTGKTLSFDLSAVSSGHTISMEFLNDKNEPLYFFKNDGVYTNLHSNMGRFVFKAIVPEGTKSIRLRGTNSRSDVPTIEVVDLHAKISEPTNILDESTETHNIATFTKPQNADKTYFINLQSKKSYFTTGNRLTTDMWYPNTTTEYLFVSVDSNFNASKFVKMTLKTKGEGVTFYGLDQKAFDKDINTYASFNREAIVTWNESIEGKSLFMSLSAVSSGKTVSVEFLDENKIPLNFYKEDGSLISKHTHEGWQSVKVIVPKGAMSIRLTGTHSRTDVPAIEIVK